MALVRAVLGLPAPTPPEAPKDIAISVQERARYVGSYELTRPDGSKNGVRVFEENGQLSFQPDGQRVGKMMSQGGDVFVVQGAGRITFDVASGRATGFVMGAGGRPLEATRR